MRKFLFSVALLVLATGGAAQCVTRLDTSVTPATSRSSYVVGQSVVVVSSSCSGCGPPVIVLTPSVPIAPFVLRLASCPWLVGTIGPCVYVGSPYAVATASPAAFVVPVVEGPMRVYVQSIALRPGAAPCVEFSPLSFLQIK